MTAHDHTAVEAARQLVGLLDPEKDKERLRTRACGASSPSTRSIPAAHTTLGRMALASSDTAEAVRAFRVALAAGPIDRASAHADLAEGSVPGRQSRRREARGAGRAGDCADLRTGADSCC